MGVGGMVFLPVAGPAIGADRTDGNQSCIAAIPAMAHGKPVGAIIVGAMRNEFEGVMLDDLRGLADDLGEVLELVGQWNVSHMSDLLELREHDSEVFGAEEALQDLPMNMSFPFGIRREATAKESEALCTIIEQTADSSLNSQSSKETVTEEEVVAAEEEVVAAEEEVTKSIDKKEVTKLIDEKEVTKSIDEKEVTKSIDEGTGWTKPCSVDTEDGTFEKPQMAALPDASGVRGFGMSTIYILATLILMSMNPDKSLGGLPAISVVCSILTFVSSLAALTSKSKKTWLGDNADVLLAGFCVMKFLLSSMNALTVHDDVTMLKHKLLQSMVIFESSLLLGMTRRSVSYGAHVAACASLTVAMVFNA
jgi:hypothetical protein